MLRCSHNYSTHHQQSTSLAPVRENKMAFLETEERSPVQASGLAKGKYQVSTLSCYYFFFIPFKAYVNIGKIPAFLIGFYPSWNYKSFQRASAASGKARGTILQISEPEMRNLLTEL